MCLKGGRRSMRSFIHSAVCLIVFAIDITTDRHTATERSVFKVLSPFSNGKVSEARWSVSPEAVTAAAPHVYVHMYPSVSEADPGGGWSRIAELFGSQSFSYDREGLVG